MRKWEGGMGKVEWGSWKGEGTQLDVNGYSLLEYDDTFIL